MIRTVVLLDNGTAPSPSASGARDGLATHLDPGAPKTAVLQQSVWSTILSAGCEYGRIVSDLFPEDGTLCFAKVEPEYAEVTPGWKPMPYAKILEAHRGVGAVEGASSMSEDQLSRLAASLCKTLGTAPRGKHTVGSGWSRVILMSSRFRHGDDAKRLGVLVEAATEEWNKSLRAVEAGSRGGIAIHHCELICAAVSPSDAHDTASLSSSLSGHTEQVLSSPTVSVASCEVASVNVISFAQRMVQQVMNLRTIVVTGLEMKLSTGDTSVNDVTLLCAQPSEIPVLGGTAIGQAASEVPSGAGVTEADSHGTSGLDALVLSKVQVIKQLKTKSGMLLPVSAAHRVTPLDVHTNATTCFIKHLLAGNSTCLSADTRSTAATKKKQEKTLSKIQCTHILREHAGALFLHSVDGSHTLVESLPTIERCAGSAIEVTEYRVQSLTELLHKYTVKSTPPAGVLPPKARLVLDTQFFPLCRSDGIIFEYPEFAPLVTAVMSDSMDWQAFEGCQTLLSQLADKRAANDEYCFSGISRSHRTGIYSRVFDEIGLLTQAYRRVSPNHEKLAVLAEQIKLSKSARPMDPRRPGGDVWDEVDKVSRMSERERSDLNSGDKNNEHLAKRRKGNSGQHAKGERGAIADMIREIQAFHADPTRTVIALPMTLTSAERREAHAMAESLGLKHSSKGTGAERHMVLSKGRDAPTAGSESAPILP